MSWGHEELTQGAHNLGIQMMGALFGPMPGSYDGPFPIKYQARDLLAAEGRFFDPWIQEPTHPLFPDWSDMPETTPSAVHEAQRALGGFEPGAPPSRLALFEERALLVGTYDGFGDPCRIVVLDAMDSDYEFRPLARYSFHCRPVE